MQDVLLVQKEDKEGLVLSEEDRKRDSQRQLVIKKFLERQVWWLIPVILATWEAGIRKLWFETSSGKKDPISTW
jgi:hypothetical protein